MIRCIFCKCNSENTKGVEHIIPESLGNIEHKLPKGSVCDSCNNYFSVKIEKKLLDKPYFRSTRHRNEIENKKKRIPSEKALIFHPKGGWVDIYKEKDGLTVNVNNPETMNLIIKGSVNKMIIPINSEPDNSDPIVSRFLAKSALEFLSYRLCELDGWNEEIVDKVELDSIREYARFGKGSTWKYNQRRIYNEEDRFTDSENHPEPYEILHEMDFLYLEDDVLYFVLVIMGIEYVINLGESEIDMYLEWLKKHNNISPIKRGTEHMLKKK
jgi:hypothetical protein